MSSATVESQPWDFRFWFAVLFLLAAQIGLILWFGAGAIIPSRKGEPGPVMDLSERGSSELFALTDPTLFSLPHREDFAGGAWLKLPPLKFRESRWSEPSRPLLLPAEQLGVVFKNFIQTNRFAAFEVAARAESKLTSPVFVPVALIPTQSTLRMEGMLATRRLVTPLALPSQPSADILNDSVVQLVVNAAGNPVSALLLPPGSGSKEADQLALQLAKGARFESLQSPGREGASRPGKTMTFGALVFEWQTVPMPATNAPPANP
jgi:hypothetical protein